MARYSFVGFEIQDSKSGSLVINVPGSTQDGDAMFMILSLNGNGSQNPTIAGWTEIIDYPTGSGGQGPIHVYYRIASSEPASYNPTASVDMVGMIAVYNSNVDLSSGANVSGGADSDSAADVTTTVNGALLLRIFCSEEAVIPTTPNSIYPAGTTGRATCEGSSICIALADELQAGAGATGTALFVPDQPSGNKGGITIGLVTKARSGAVLLP